MTKTGTFGTRYLLFRVHQASRYARDLSWVVISAAT